MFVCCRHILDTALHPPKNTQHPLLPPTPSAINKRPPKPSSLATHSQKIAFGDSKYLTYAGAVSTIVGATNIYIKQSCKRLRASSPGMRRPRAPQKRDGHRRPRWNGRQWQRVSLLMIIIVCDWPLFTSRPCFSVSNCRGNTYHG